MSGQVISVMFRVRAEKQQETRSPAAERAKHSNLLLARDPAPPLGTEEQVTLNEPCRLGWQHLGLRV